MVMEPHRIALAFATLLMSLLVFNTMAAQPQIDNAPAKRENFSLAGSVEIEVIKGQEHDMWKGWFESHKLTNFVIARALEQPLTEPMPTAPKHR